MLRVASPIKNLREAVPADSMYSEYQHTANITISPSVSLQAKAFKKKNYHRLMTSATCQHP